MRRAVIVLGTTAAGLAALLSFKTHSLAAPAASAGAPAPSAGTSSPAGSAAGQAASATHGASSTAPAAARTVTGAVASTQHGPMQVQLTLAGTKITKVTLLQRTDDGAESDQIDAYAIPKLTSETLAAQSAHIDAVSGASYTSSGYIQSLQSALDKASI
ncbi:MAG TPA: FMN-binding protein [Trebonia sp.]|jgi:uncharacterized protein with FMN-binding domain|nr:FMN-binding protein [Trebonia sp.]